LPALIAIGLLGGYAGVAAAADLPPGGTFTDDDGITHEPYIEALVVRGITNGCGPGLYCPSQPVTRAELAAFVLRTTGTNVDNRAYAGHFTDVPATAWYAPYVERVYELGIMAGYDNSTFQPNELVMRGVFAEVLAGVLGEEVEFELRDSYFSDVPAAIRYRPHIDRLYELEITNGCSSAPLMYCPNEYIMRGQLATFLGRGLNLAPILAPGATTTTTVATTTTEYCPPG
jgi:hypothetical protein